MQNEKTITIDLEQALQLLAQATRRLQMSADDHDVLKLCLDVLRQRIVDDQETIKQLGEAVERANGIIPLDSSALLENASHGSNGTQQSVSE